MLNKIINKRNIILGGIGVLSSISIFTVMACENTKKSETNEDANSNAKKVISITRKDIVNKITFSGLNGSGNVNIVNDISNVTLMSEAKNIKNGDEITINVTPSEGYILSNNNLASIKLIANGLIDEKLNLADYNTPNELVEKLVNLLNAKMPIWAGRFLNNVYDLKEDTDDARNAFANVKKYMESITTNKTIAIEYNEKTILLDFMPLKAIVDKITILMSKGRENLQDALAMAKAILDDNAKSTHPEITALTARSLHPDIAMSITAFLGISSTTDVWTSEYYQMLNAYHKIIWNLKTSDIFSEWIANKEYIVYMNTGEAIIEYPMKPNTLFDIDTVYDSSNMNNYPDDVTLRPINYMPTLPHIYENGRLQVSILETVFGQTLLNTEDLKNNGL